MKRYSPQEAMELDMTTHDAKIVYLQLFSEEDRCNAIKIYEKLIENQNVSPIDRFLGAMPTSDKLKILHESLK